MNPTKGVTMTEIQTPIDDNKTSERSDKRKMTGRSTGHELTETTDEEE